MNLVFQIDTPLCTVQEFGRRSGIPERTINKKIANGEIPAAALSLHPDRSGSKYINLVQLYRLCADQEFTHPQLKAV